jgi:hypothetical protein
MRFSIFCAFLALLAGSGCFHRKAAAPQENFSDVPGLPTAPPAETTADLRPPKKEVARQKHPAEAHVPVTPAEPKPAEQKLIVTPENGLVGKVEMVNQNARYVVLSFPIGHLPAMEQRLNVYRRGLKIGEVKVSGPQIEDNVVADIVAGDSEPGDEVREK